MNAPQAEPRSLVERFLAWCGIDAQMYFALLRAYLAMDLRNQEFGAATSTGAKDVVAPVVLVLAQNLLMGLVLAGVLFARVDAFFFATAALALVMALTANTVLVEFHEVVLNPEDLEIITHHPLPWRTYTAARITNLFVFLSGIIVSLSLFPTLLGAGLRDATWWFAPAFFLASIGGGLLAAGLVILGYLAVGMRAGANEARERLAYVQFAMMVVVIMPLMFMLRWSTAELQYFAYQPPAWLVYLPPSWLALAIARPSWAGGEHVVFAVAGFSVALVGVWILVLSSLAGLYAKMGQGRAVAERHAGFFLPEPGEIAGLWTRWFTRPGEERTGFWLASTMLRRDINFRMRCLPAFGLPLVLVFAGWWTGQLGRPGETELSEAGLTLLAIYLAAPAMLTALFQTNFSDDFAASWVLQTAPMVDRFRFTLGMHKVVAWRLAFPLMFLLGAALSLAWRDLGVAAWNIAPGVLALMAAGYLAQASTMRKVAFSAPSANGASLGSVALPLAALSCVAAALASIHFFTIQNKMAYAGYLLGLAIFAQALRWAVKRRLNSLSKLRSP